MTVFNNIYEGKRVFITGHAGFKGSWLALWLTKMGAIVKGYSLYPITAPSHWNLLGLNIESVNWDIGDLDKLTKEILDFQPDIVFHLSAQAIVLQAYENPVQTYEINVIGTLKLLEACRKCDSVRAIINITSDKCYDNKEWVFSYRETDAVGGYDPYSSSKACSELLTASYRNSYWNLNNYPEKHHVLLATCRAGNVIGGGDWARDRLIPNTVRSVIDKGMVLIRDSEATRPWLHVLDVLSGYMLVGQKLLEGHKECAKAWNFGSSDGNNISVEGAVILMQEYWAEIKIGYIGTDKPYEARLLNLDSSQSRIELKWYPIWDIRKTIEKTTLWYKNYINSKSILSSVQINEYIEDAKKQNLIWTK